MGELASTHIPAAVLQDVQGTPYCFDESAREQLAELATRVRQLRAAGELSPEVLRRIRQYFRIKNIYHSNAIEGNQLGVGETRLVVEQGLTLTGKPLKDQAEARNLSHALDFLEDLASDPTRAITEGDVRQIHALVLKGIDDDNAGRYRSVSVEISGSAYKPPPPEQVAIQIREFATWLANASVRPTFDDALLLAAAAHAWLATIHPFIDGNGRVARLLMNLLLMRSGYPIAVITKDDRTRYYDALEESQDSNLTPLLVLLGETIAESLEEYEQAAREQRQDEEWARSIAGKFSAQQRAQVDNEYELWKSAMDLMKGYFRQTAELLDQEIAYARVFFKDFGVLEFEKYTELRRGVSTKKTWSFRIDIRSGERSARYLFFFGYPTRELRQDCAVTIHVAREERPFFYEKLEFLSAPNVPSLLEIGYKPRDESFIARYRGGLVRLDKIENIGRRFIEEVVQMHFSGD